MFTNSDTTARTSNVVAVADPRTGPSTYRMTSGEWAAAAGCRISRTANTTTTVPIANVAKCAMSIARGTVREACPVSSPAVPFTSKPEITNTGTSRANRNGRGAAGRGGRGAPGGGAQGPPRRAVHVEAGDHESRHEQGEQERQAGGLAVGQDAAGRGQRAHAVE